MNQWLSLELIKPIQYRNNNRTTGKHNLSLITHGASEASGVRNFWHLSTKILYTVKPKTATSPCVHFEVAVLPTEKNITSPCIHF